MKTIILLILLSLCTISCVSQKVFSIYTKNYPTEQLAIKDIYSQTKVFGSDSIPLDKWITLGGANFDGTVVQKIISYKPNPKTQYRFTYSTFFKSDTTLYMFNIVCDTKDKALQKEYVKK